jgi:hypothetical protein
LALKVWDHLVHCFAKLPGYRPALIASAVSPLQTPHISRFALVCSTVSKISQIFENRAVFEKQV